MVSELDLLPNLVSELDPLVIGAVFIDPADLS